jgi:hypothetical protein
VHRSDGKPSSNPEQGKMSMWVKILSQWVASLIFLWVLIAPIVLKNRQF